MKIAPLIFIAIIVLMFLTACAKAPEKPSGEIKEEVVMSTKDVSAEIENDISDTGTLDTDLDATELDTLDKDLEEVNW